MKARRVVAALIVCAAAALLGVGLLSDARLHAFLSRGAGHSVTWGYVDDFRHRAIVCGVLAIAVAFVAWRLPLRRNVEDRHSCLSGQAGVPVLHLLLAIGAVTRLAFLFLPPRYDEAFTVTEFVSRSPLNFLIHYRFANNHVLHTLLAWIVSTVAGHQMWALRLPAFFAGMGVLITTYYLARRLKDEKTALIATALAAVASPLVEYSAQARGYTILTLAFLLLYLFANELLAAIALAAGAWTIPTMIYAAGAWGLWTALFQKAWRRVFIVGLAGGAIAFLLYAPMIVTSGVATFTESGVTRALTLPEFARDFPRLIAEVWQEWNLSFPMPVAILIGVAALIACVRRTPAAMPFVAALLAIVPMLLILRRLPFSRTWLFLLPLYLIAAASAFADLVPDRFRKAGAVLLLAVTALLSWSTIRSQNRPDFYPDPAMKDVPAVAQWIRTLPPDSRVLVTSPLDAPYMLYARGRIIEDRFDSDPAAVRAAVIAAPRRYFVASTVSGGMEKFEALRLPYERTVVARFPHSIAFELR